MNRTLKLVLDIVIGAVIPVLILNNLNEQLGTVMTYIAAAMVSVAWVLIDLFLITRRFNFISSYVGTFAIGRGLLSFWFVDGLLYAIKDSAGFIFATLIFGGSMLLRRPIMYYFIVQGFNPSSLKQERSLKRLLKESRVRRALLQGTKLVLIVSILSGLANFFLNLKIVEASFGTVAFNQQVAQVNAITIIALSIPEFIGFWIAVVSTRRAMFHYLPIEDDEDQDESDFWELLQLRESQIKDSTSYL
ncbi:MAG: VC0807 family protein [Phormidesmis sp.]